MKNVIIGTAGHIDHGKSTLIKAITGRETDRLKEEKERGISIELGFTYFDLPSGRRAGIIDVPGHEKFIKNMLAGVMGIDVVLLVIAADEGIMPQTKEHLNILNLLGIEKGLIALTKADLVDEEWLALVEEDIKDGVKGTFLENSPIIPVSSVTKSGIDKVIETIEHLTEEVKDRDINETARLPVDRVFSMSGFGTIVTGTLYAGKFQIGDEIQVFPGTKVGRIRSIQVHGADSDTAYGGQRVAINIAGLKKSDIERGNVIAPVNSMESTMMLDVKLKLLEDSQRIIDNRTRLRLYIGSSEVLCRVVFLDRDQLTPGESCYAQLRLEEEIVAKRGDRFIIRFYSPMMTIGGGEILEPNPPKRKRFDKEVIRELEIKEKGQISDVIEEIIKDKSSSFPTLKDISVSTVMTEEKIEKIIDQLKEENKILTYRLLKDLHIIHTDYKKYLSNKIKEELDSYHKKNPLKAGMPKEEIRSKYLGSIKQKLGDSFINNLIEDKVIKQVNESIALIDFEVKFSPAQEEIRDVIEKEFLRNKFNPLKREELYSLLKYSTKDIDQVFEALLDIGILIRLKDENILHTNAYIEAVELVKDFITQNGSISVAQLRDLLNSNRKLAIALIEYLDDLKVTKRLGDTRVLY
ncbi:Selenocysteine-specific elongation factor SelB translation factor [Proteiniborus sp. DW1]|uniref:selenocysteine-specific translation elongation factor n=1 Tax=Proteiniborus sp. DW1 TaxID=1889883 RepID=UPI00092E136C|nr:selenocysteine-specific translation elongation factor [Proteiniborus sp. DW1]SCG83706.1 Selenocysteine-specific elongation factor SelB translation factor [Proteiniborus sp. DW1]